VPVPASEPPFSPWGGRACRLGGGITVGEPLGDSDGDVEGVPLGDELGEVEGVPLGEELGEEDVLGLGEPDMLGLGDVDGELLGEVDGVPLGEELGEEDALVLGLGLGEVEGVPLGDGLGEDDGVVPQFAEPVVLPTPPTVPWSPHTLTGTLIGTAGWFPERIPPEFEITLVVVELGGVGLVHSVAPVVPVTEPTPAWLPQALTGTLIGVCTEVPDAMPPELIVALVAEVLPP